MARVDCTAKVEIDYSTESGAVEQVKIHLPRKVEYRQESGSALLQRDWLRIFDWSWAEFEFVSHLNAGVEFEVVGVWSDDRKSQVVAVISDTPKHALAKANAIQSDDTREFIPRLVLFDGEVIATAD